MNDQEKTNKAVESSVSHLLKGQSDEERLAGLLLATKFCNADDHASILKVYDAIGVQFLDRLLMTGIGKGNLIGDNKRENEDSYLLLSVTLFSALCRVPEIAASKHMVSKVPVILEILQKRDAIPSVYDECYEILFLVSTASADGLTTLYESKGMIFLASHMPCLSDGSHTLELAIGLLQLMLSRLPLEITNIAYPSELSCVVMTLARQFALLHNALKFEVLHLLSTILSSKYSAPVLDALRLMTNDDWTTYIRVGVVAVLQNRVASVEKLQALVLAESVISIVGESWLIDQKNLIHETEPIPVDRCLLLVLESSRVEVAVLLNELAYLKYEASEDSSAMVDSIILKQRNLGIAFSLIEKIIKLISSSCEDKGNSISERTLMKVITGLNETIGVVLDFLQDAKDHGQTKGDDLLASVRIIGSYLAETPFACKEKVESLLEYLLSITSEDELSPFYSICFLLPMLCQITMETEGCMMLASFAGQKPVVECLIKMIDPKSPQSEDSATIFLACDTIMNLLLKSREIPFQLDGYNFVHLLGALACWTEEANDQSVVMMASSICSLIFESTSEEALLTHFNFDLSTVNSLSRLIARSLATCGKEMSDVAKADTDLHQIVSMGYARWADRFPHIKQAVQSMKRQR